jgi:hypothetical protein
MLANRSPTAAVFFGFFEDLLTVLAMSDRSSGRVSDGREANHLWTKYGTVKDAEALSSV